VNTQVTTLMFIISNQYSCPTQSLEFLTSFVHRCPTELSPTKTTGQQSPIPSVSYSRRRSRTNANRQPWYGVQLAIVLFPKSHVFFCCSQNITRTHTSSCMCLASLAPPTPKTIDHALVLYLKLIYLLSNNESKEALRVAGTPPEFPRFSTFFSFVLLFVCLFQVQCRQHYQLVVLLPRHEQVVTAQPSYCISGPHPCPTT
jgi:hypothetical protein